MEYLAENITLKGSHFFSGVGGYETLDRECLPALAKRDKVRVWCAGCSSGEEVYSLVMALAEHVDPDRIEVLATDYNEELLERCRRASYSVSRLEEVPERCRHYLCMSDTGKRFSFSDELLGSVTVRHLNLLEDESPKEFDLISCRNVIKLFARDAKARVLAGLASSLAPGGYLFLATNNFDSLMESIPRPSMLGLRRIGHTNIYQRIV